jgi:hypothetical protein
MEMWRPRTREEDLQRVKPIKIIQREQEGRRR